VLTSPIATMADWALAPEELIRPKRDGPTHSVGPFVLWQPERSAFFPHGPERAAKSASQGRDLEIS
jgi:hypothetical protein